MVQIFNSTQWELFVEEWLEVKKNQYQEIERPAGANDKGVDVLAYITKPDKKGDYTWDCYQCKHYNNPISPSDVWIEIGKIIYYSFKGEYPVPDNYYFVAPKNVGTKLSGLLRNPEKLRKGLIENWDKYCKTEITNTDTISIDAGTDLRKYLDSFDFGIFQKVATKQVIAEHANHKNHISTFGGGFPDRPDVVMPEDIGDQEHKYVQKLIKVYESHTGTSDLAPEKLIGECEQHFKRARIGFHHAEQLKNFSRDITPQGSYENFQEEIYTSVQFIGGDGFQKVINVEQEAIRVPLDSNTFKTICTVRDRIGVCHQLSNDDRLLWN